MSLQHDVKRYKLEYIDYDMIPAEDGQYVLLTDYEAVCAKLEDAKRDAASWKSHWEMYRDAWVRELGGWLFPKSHLIDALVLTTRARCVNPIFGNCSAPHYLGKPTADGKALQQTAHPSESGCKQWKAVEPESQIEAVRGEVERLTAAKEEGDLRYAEIARQRDFEWDRRKRAEARAETAEASLRSLRDALETDASGRPFHMLLWEAAQALDVHGSGPLVDCLKIKSSEIESLLDALTPAAPDSTKSTESTAARKDKE